MNEFDENEIERIFKSKYEHFILLSDFNENSRQFKSSENSKNWKDTSDCWVKEFKSVLNKFNNMSEVSLLNENFAFKLIVFLTINAWEIKDNKRSNWFFLIMIYLF